LATPKKGEHRLSEMLSENSSLETKANASRWYLEMMIDLFLSKESKQNLSEIIFKKLSLSDKIEDISKYYSKDIIDTLHLIKNVGDKGSHYSSDVRLNKKEIDTVVKKATNLFTLILIDHLKKEPLDKTYNRAVIFSTLLPSIRENVLYSLINFKKIETEMDYALLDKYIIACTKNNRINQIKKKLKELNKKNIIDSVFYSFQLKSIQAIEQGMKKNELPIPKTMEDCKRNLNSVINTLDENEINDNQELIDIMNTLLENVEPSKIESFKENHIYVIT
jgi:hypothetical protein